MSDSLFRFPAPGDAIVSPTGRSATVIARTHSVVVYELPDGTTGNCRPERVTRPGDVNGTIHAVTIPGHGLYRAYDDDVEDILSRYANPRDNGRRGMLHDANEIATPVDFSDVSTSALAVILASFTPESSGL